MNALGLYHDLKVRSVFLEAQGEHLKVDAPAGVLTAEDKAALMEFKPKLLKFLSCSNEELQTTTQILRCLTLGRYTAAVEDGELKVRGPQPLAGSLTGSVKARRNELVAFLNEWGGGVWPPAPGSGLREVEQFLDCGQSTALDVVETAQRGAAYHGGTDLDAQEIVDAYLASRPQEERAWDSYTEAYQEANQSRGIDGLLEISLTDRAFSEAAG